MTWAALLALAFLAGSIPFGLLIAKSKGVDIRAHGSGNIGATNVGRVLGKRFGFACFFLDALKGALPVVIAGLVVGLWGRPLEGIASADAWLWLAVGMLALLGHMFSPWIGFKGGKGVATGFGAMVAMWTPLTLPAARRNLQAHLDLWCNGSTNDSGSFSPRSNRGWGTRLTSIVARWNGNSCTEYLPLRPLPDDISLPFPLTKRCPQTTPSHSASSQPDTCLGNYCLKEYCQAAAAGEVTQRRGHTEASYFAVILESR